MVRMFTLFGGPRHGFRWNDFWMDRRPQRLTVLESCVGIAECDLQEHHITMWQLLVRHHNYGGFASPDNIRVAIYERWQHRHKLKEALTADLHYSYTETVTPFFDTVGRLHVMTIEEQACRLAKIEIEMLGETYGK